MCGIGLRARAGKIVRDRSPAPIAKPPLRRTNTRSTAVAHAKNIPQISLSDCALPCRIRARAHFTAPLGSTWPALRHSADKITFGLPVMRFLRHQFNLGRPYNAEPKTKKAFARYWLS